MSTKYWIWKSGLGHEVANVLGKQKQKVSRQKSQGVAWPELQIREG